MVYVMLEIRWSFLTFSIFNKTMLFFKIRQAESIMITEDESYTLPILIILTNNEMYIFQIYIVGRTTPVFELDLITHLESSYFW